MSGYSSTHGLPLWQLPSFWELQPQTQGSIGDIDFKGAISILWCCWAVLEKPCIFILFSNISIESEKGGIWGGQVWHDKDFFICPMNKIKKYRCSMGWGWESLEGLCMSCVTCIAVLSVRVISGVTHIADLRQEKRLHTWTASLCPHVDRICMQRCHALSAFQTQEM